MTRFLGKLGKDWLRGEGNEKRLNMECSRRVELGEGESEMGRKT
jgi:hypothetical protein